MALPDHLISTLSESVEADDADTIRHAIVTYKLNGRDLGEWLTMASHLGHMDAMEALLEHDADVHWKNEDGETAFSFACAYDQFDAARLLHQHGADINSVDSSGSTPLDWAVCHARPEFRAWLKDCAGSAGIGNRLAVSRDSVADLLPVAGAMDRGMNATATIAWSLRDPGIRR